MGQGHVSAETCHDAQSKIVQQKFELVSTQSIDVDSCNQLFYSCETCAFKLISLRIDNSSLWSQQPYKFWKPALTRKADDSFGLLGIEVDNVVHGSEDEFNDDTFGLFGIVVDHVVEAGEDDSTLKTNKG